MSLKQELVMHLISTGRAVKLRSMTRELDPAMTAAPGLWPFDAVSHKRYREIDRVLQGLRRSGKISFDTKLGWKVVECATE